MTTMKDIARLTGVSTATVSNVLNGKHGAAGAAKAREILSVAESLHYKPNAFAKNLKIQKSNTIGIITEDLTVFHTPEIVDGINAYCEVHGYEMILVNMRLFKRYHNNFTDTPEHHKLLDDLVSNVSAKQVEGIVYVGYHCREIAYLPSRVNVPFVYAYCYPSEEVYPSVLFNDQRAAEQVMDILVKNGNRRIGMVTGPSSSDHTKERLCGAQKSLRKHGIPFDPALVWEGDWEFETGYRLAHRVINSGTTAIFAFNDLMAAGISRYCSENKIIIGRDLDLFGFDNRDIVSYYLPPIASVQLPLHEMGQRSVELVLSMAKKKKVRSEPLRLNCDILVRPSIAQR